jgi:hypothetical protein
LPKEKWELRVAGSLDFEPEYARAMLRQAVRLEIAGQVSFLILQVDRGAGQSDARQPPDGVTHSYEGFGIAYLEGMSSGCRPSQVRTAQLARSSPRAARLPGRAGDAARLAGCLGKLLETGSGCFAHQPECAPALPGSPYLGAGGEKARQFLLDMINFR